MFLRNVVGVVCLLSAATAQAVVADGSQSIVQYTLFQTGATSAVPQSTNDLSVHPTTAGATWANAVKAEASAASLGAMARAVSDGTSIFSMARGTYFEFVTFAAPAAGAQLSYTWTLDGRFTAPLDTSGSSATARALMYVVDVTGATALNVFGPTVRPVSWGTNYACAEIKTSTSGAWLSSGCANTSAYSPHWVDGPIQDQPLSVSTSGQLTVQDGHRYMFISEVYAAATTSKTVGEVVEANALHTLKMQVNSLGGATVVHSSGPLLAAAMVPEPETWMLGLTGVGLLVGVRRWRAGWPRHSARA